MRKYPVRVGYFYGILEASIVEMILNWYIAKGKELEAVKTI